MRGLDSDMIKIYLLNRYIDAYRRHIMFGRNHGGARHERRHARGGFGPGLRLHLGRGRHGGGGRGRVFDQGELRFVILRLVAEKPRHGYEIIKAIEERLAGAYSPSPGVIYPTLTLLEELGYATASDGEGGRKRYTVTPEGEAFLAANQATVEAIFARMAARSAAGGEPPAPIVRAMENL